MALSLIARKPTPISLSTYSKAARYFILRGLMNFVLWWKVSNLKPAFTYGSFWRAKTNRKSFKDSVKSLQTFLFSFLFQAFSKVGPLLSATIAKKKDPKKPGKCAAIIPALVIPVVFLCTVIAIVASETFSLLSLFTFYVARKYQSCGKFSSWHGD